MEKSHPNQDRSEGDSERPGMPGVSKPEIAAVSPAVAAVPPAVPAVPPAVPVSPRAAMATVAGPPTSEGPGYAMFIRREIFDEGFDPTKDNAPKVVFVKRPFLRLQKSQLPASRQIPPGDVKPDKSIAMKPKPQSQEPQPSGSRQESLFPDTEKSPVADPLDSIPKSELFRPRIYTNVSPPTRVQLRELEVSLELPPQPSTSRQNPPPPKKIAKKMYVLDLTKLETGKHRENPIVEFSIPQASSGEAGNSKVERAVPEFIKPSNPIKPRPFWMPRVYRRRGMRKRVAEHRKQVDVMLPFRSPGNYTMEQPMAQVPQVNSPVIDPPTAVNLSVISPPAAVNSPAINPPAAVNSPAISPLAAVNSPAISPPAAVSSPVSNPPAAVNSPVINPPAVNPPKANRPRGMGKRRAAPKEPKELNVPKEQTREPKPHTTIESEIEKCIQLDDAELFKLIDEAAAPGTSSLIDFDSSFDFLSPVKRPRNRQTAVATSRPRRGLGNLPAAEKPTGAIQPASDLPSNMQQSLMPAEGDPQDLESPTNYTASEHLEGWSKLKKAVSETAVPTCVQQETFYKNLTKLILLTPRRNLIAADEDSSAPEAVNVMSLIEELEKTQRHFHRTLTTG